MPSPALLDEVIEAHGGAARFDSADRLTAHLGCSGLAFLLKGQRGALADFRGTVSTTEPRITLEPFSGAGKRGVLENDTVRIESASGEVLAERAHPRDFFRRFRRNLRWDDLDLLYFAAYALWGYLTVPFLLRAPGFEVEEAEPWREGGETWRGLRAVFPEGLPAHSREQFYYFGDDGLIRRNDYTAEVFGSWAKAAHYCWDHRDFSGLIVPTRRKAMPRRRNGRPRTQVALVSISIHDVTLHAGEPAG
jgi:hypothetical protein